jgi:ABC-type multidrug transport system fused ATPase/permease subunit
MVEKKKTIPKPKPRPKQKRIFSRSSDKPKRQGRYNTDIYGAGAAALATGMTVQALRSNKVEKEKKEKERQRNREMQKQKRGARVNKDKVKLAQMRIKDLKKINTSTMNDKEKKERKALIKQQQNIVKGLTKTTAKELAKQVGLRTIPFVGAFLAALDSKPAGAGSAKFGPGSKEKK